MTTDIPDEIKNDSKVNKTLDPEPVKYEDEIIMPSTPPITPQKNSTSPSIPKSSHIQIKNFIILTNQKVLIY